MDEPTRRFLETQSVAHLATADATGVPHVVPICFALIGQTLYVAIDEKPKRGDFRRLRRLRNIAENPRVAVVADHYEPDWTKLGFVLAHGSARILSEGDDEHARAVAALRDKYPQYQSMALEERPMIAADIVSVSTWGRLGA